MKPFPPSSVGARPYCYPPSEGLGEVVCPNSCDRPSPSAWQPHEGSRSFFRADTGVCPYGWMHLFHPFPSFRMKNAVFVLPKLHFRCISNTLQSYEKFLKLTNCKHKIFKNFSSERLYCYVSSSCKNQIVKYWLQTIYIVYRHLSTAPSLAYFDYRLQITVYLWTHYPVLNLKKKQNM